MFVPMIAVAVALIVIMAYMSSSSLVVNSTEIKMAFEKVKYSFSTESVIYTAVESLCQKDPATCQSKYSGGVINLNATDLSGYIPTNFDYSNVVGGSYTGIQIVDNNTTIRITHNIDNDATRKVYLNHYAGREFGISPECVAGSKDSAPACDSVYVYHDYPTSLATRAALE